MKPLMKLALLTLAIASSAFSQDHVGGGGDFHYMRSLEALKENELRAILKDNGEAYMKTVITPSSWVGIHPSGQYGTVTSTQTFWRKMSQGGLFAMWKKIESTKLQDCSCADVVEEESSDNQICAKQDKQENMICLDVQKILDPKEKINLDYDTLLGAIWHELGHLYVPETAHSVLYELGNDMKNHSNRGRLLTSKLFTPDSRPAKCFINQVQMDAINLHQCAKKAFASSEEKDVIMKYKYSGFGGDYVRGVFSARNGLKSDNLHCEVKLREPFFRTVFGLNFVYGYTIPEFTQNKFVDIEALSFSMQFDLKLTVKVIDPEDCLDIMAHDFERNHYIFDGFGKLKIEDSKGRNILKISP